MASFISINAEPLTSALSSITRDLNVLRLDVDGLLARLGDAPSAALSTQELPSVTSAPAPPTEEPAPPPVVEQAPVVPTPPVAESAPTPPAEQPGPSTTPPSPPASNPESASESLLARLSSLEQASGAFDASVARLAASAEARAQASAEEAQDLRSCMLALQAELGASREADARAREELCALAVSVASAVEGMRALECRVAAAAEAQESASAVWQEWSRRPVQPITAGGMHGLTTSPAHAELLSVELEVPVAAHVPAVKREGGGGIDGGGDGGGGGGSDDGGGDGGAAASPSAPIDEPPTPEPLAPCMSPPAPLGEGAPYLAPPQTPPLRLLPTPPSTPAPPQLLSSGQQHPALSAGSTDAPCSPAGCPCGSSRCCAMGHVLSRLEALEAFAELAWGRAAAGADAGEGLGVAGAAGAARASSVVGQTRARPGDASPSPRQLATPGAAASGSPTSPGACFFRGRSLSGRSPRGGQADAERCLACAGDILAADAEAAAGGHAGSRWLPAGALPPGTPWLSLPPTPQQLEPAPRPQTPGTQAAGAEPARPPSWGVRPRAQARGGPAGWRPQVPCVRDVQGGGVTGSRMGERGGQGA